MRVLHFAILLSPVLVSPAFAAAPSALFGKSVTVSWTETRSQREGQSGAFRQVGIPYSNIFYVSSAGRVFMRTSARGRGAGGSNDKVGNGGNAAGDSREVKFSGNRIVSSTKFQGAARQVSISFDSSLSSCTAQVITAMPVGAKTAVVRSIATGSTVEFESVSAGPASCSIASGNPF